MRSLAFPPAQKSLHRCGFTGSAARSPNYCKSKTLLCSALSFSVATAVYLLLLATARCLLSAAATVLLSLPTAV